jgi:hypothetical protein
MNNNMSVLEKLTEVSSRETKRREQAVNYLNTLTEQLTPIFKDVFGCVEYVSGDTQYIKWIPAYDKEKKEYNTSNSEIYFRFGNHHGDNSTEYPGFYKSYEYPFWGDDVTELKGQNFWIAVKQITDWLNNCLSDELDIIEKSRDQRFEQLEKIVTAIKEA